MKIHTDDAGALPAAFNHSGRLGEPVLAAGQLRQGRAPSMAAMMTGWALVGLARGRKSKTLPGHFVLAVTATEVVAYKASGGGGGQGEEPYAVRVKDDVEGRWPRSQVVAEDLGEQGRASKDVTLVVAGERIEATRPNLNGDPNTDLLLAVLSGEVDPAGPPEDTSQPRERGSLLDPTDLLNL